MSYENWIHKEAFLVFWNNLELDAGIQVISRNWTPNFAAVQVAFSTRVPTTMVRLDAGDTVLGGPKPPVQQSVIIIAERKKFNIEVMRYLFFCLNDKEESYDNLGNYTRWEDALTAMSPGDFIRLRKAEADKAAAR